MFAFVVLEAEKLLKILKNSTKSFHFLRYPSSRSSTVKSYAVTGSNLYPETTIREPIDRSGTIPSRSTLHSLRNIENNNVGRNSTLTSRHSIFIRTVSSQRLLSTLMNQIKLVLGRATCTVHLISAQTRPARKETNVPLHNRS